MICLLYFEYSSDFTALDSIESIESQIPSILSICGQGNFK